MSTALRARNADLQPRAAGGGWQGILLSILVHGGLLAALVWGVRWSQPAVDVVAAELWAAVPQAAAPPAVATPPAPAPAPVPPKPAPVATPKPPATQQADADIALEKARKAKAEEERAEKLKAEKLRAEKAQAEKDAREKRQKEEREKQERAEKAEKAEKAAKAEKDAKARQEADRKTKAAEQELARQREQNLARMMGQLGGSGPAPTGATGAAGAPSASYAGRLVAAIKPNIVFAESLPGNPAAEVEVRAGPGGTILGRTLIKSSGHPEWDEAVLRAIDRTGTLPRDVDGRVPPRLTITFRPRD